MIGYRNLPQTTDRLAEGQGVQHELGARYLYVTSDCRYFVRRLEYRMGELWSPARTGRLSEGDVERINRELWQLDLGEDSGAMPGLFDADIREIWLGERASSCVGDCVGAPEQLSTAVSAARALLDELYERGTSVHGGVRVFVHVFDVPDGEDLFPFVTWEGPPVFAEIAVAREVDPGQTFGDHILLEGETAEMLRSIRDRLIVEQPAQFDYGFIPISEGGTLFSVYGRDAIPIENEAGLIARPE